MAASVEDYASLKARHRSEGTLYTDPHFPASLFSIANREHPGKIPPGVRWRRPKDFVANPKFISGYASRFDLDQGRLGDCWFVSAASVLAVSNRKCFERCVPQDQSFDDDDYAGIFRFNFWRFGRWVEVVVDDQLPTVSNQLCYCRNRDDPSEFWAALLEKAFAKLHGCYAAIDGGHISDALVDFTGGISEMIKLKPVSKLPDNFFNILHRTNQMNSMMGVSISSKTRELGLTNGLYTGHAYCINDVRKISVDGTTVNLLRLRNPWGRGEWNGAWSDGSPEWRSLSDADKRTFGLMVRDDGEFWITYEDMLECFTDVKMCHLSPDAITVEAAQDANLRDWKLKSFHGEWIRGFNAGGCGQPPNQGMLWKNSQYQVRLTEADDGDGDGKCTMVVSLMQKDEQLTSDLYIGFIIFRFRPKPGAMEMEEGKRYNHYSLITKNYSPYSNVREMTAHIPLPPGDYVIVPTTYEVDKEGEYLLRIFTEKGAEAEEVDVPTRIRKPYSETKKQRKQLFEKFSHGDRHMDAKELNTFLDEFFKGRRDPPVVFGRSTATRLIAVLDKNDNGTIEFKEFNHLAKNLDEWANTFDKYDKDSSGLIDTIELEDLFNDIGFSVGRKLIRRFARLYGGKDRKMDFEDFLICIAVVYDITRATNRTEGLSVERAAEERLARE